PTGISGIGSYSRYSKCDSEISVARSEEHTSELQSRENLVCRLLLEKKAKRPDKRQCFLKTPRARIRSGVFPPTEGPLPDPGAGATGWGARSVFFFLKDPPPPGFPLFPLPSAFQI